MERKKIVIVAGLLLALGAAVYWIYALWFAAPSERPMLMYFRADL